MIPLRGDVLHLDTSIRHKRVPVRVRKHEQRPGFTCSLCLRGATKGAHISSPKSSHFHLICRFCVRAMAKVLP